MKPFFSPRAAEKYVEKHGLPASGYVLVWMNRIVGWVPDVCEPPRRLRPGVVAMAVNDPGTLFRAAGGHVITGAAYWIPCRNPLKSSPNETSN